MEEWEPREEGRDEAELEIESESYISSSTGFGRAEGLAAQMTPTLPLSVRTT